MPGVAGLDASAYPGDATMAWLKSNTNFKWCGFYLGPAPSHSDTGWMGKRAVLKGQGWGLAPLYVGQQVIAPGSLHPDAGHGHADGLDAVKLLKKAGFGEGTAVYLDLENGKPFTSAQKSYLSAWVDEVEHAGFIAGVYCSHTIAEDVHQVAPTAFLWVFKVSTNAPHPVPGPVYPDNHPAGSGYAGAYIWQLGQACKIAAQGAPKSQLLVDLDSAISPDPGQPKQPLAAIEAATTAAADHALQG